jgi:hypothetical protein
MISEEEIARTADRLKDALGAAADVMAARDAPAGALAAIPVQKAGSARGWLLPLTAAASVVAIVLTAVFVGHLVKSPAARGGAADAGTARPEFYMTTTWTTKLVLQVRRTANGAVTASASVPGTIPELGYLTADASDRAFFIATFPCTTAPQVSTFYRIMITGSGQISGIALVGAPVRGVVTDLAASPDGSRIAFDLKPSPGCMNTPQVAMPSGAVHIMDLSSGAVRTWRDTTSPAIPPDVEKRITQLKEQVPSRSINYREVTEVTNSVSGLSWSPDGRTLVVDESWHVPLLSQPYLAVYELDTTGAGDSLQADSRLVLSQEYSCVTCVQEVLAGPGGRLTALEVQPAGRHGSRLLVVLLPSAGGRTPAGVLYSVRSSIPAADGSTGMYADPSGRWVIVWPFNGNNAGWERIRAGWISGGTLHPLPGTTLVSPNAIAW